MKSFDGFIEFRFSGHERDAKHLDSISKLGRDLAEAGVDVDATSTPRRKV